MCPLDQSTCASQVGAQRALAEWTQGARGKEIFSHRDSFDDTDVISISHCKATSGSSFFRESSK